MSSNLDIYMENRLYLSAPCFVLDEKKLYFSNRSCNALVIADRETWNVESMVPFVGEEIDTRNLHFGCCKLGNNVCFLPHGKNKLHVYDTESGEQKVYELGGGDNEVSDVLWLSHVWQDRIYLMPCGGDLRLWSLDLDGQLRMESWWGVNADPDGDPTHGPIDEQRFFTLIKKTGEFIITNLEKKETETYYFPDKKLFYFAYDGRDFWYASFDNADIVKWNPEDGEQERYSFPMWDKCNPGGLPYFFIYAVGQEIFVVSGTEKELFVLDKKERILKPVFQFPEFSHIYKETERLTFLTSVRDKLLWTFWGVGRAAVIDPKTMEGKMYQDVIPMNETVRDYFDKILFQNAPLIFEGGDGWDLERFLYHCKTALKETDRQSR